MHFFDNSCNKGNSYKKNPDFCYVCLVQNLEPTRDINLNFREYLDYDTKNGDKKSARRQKIIELRMMKRQKSSLNSATGLEFAIPSSDPNELADNYIYFIRKKM